MINDVLCERVIKNSNKTFITYQNKQISYSQFNWMVNNCMDYLEVNSRKYVGLKIKDKLKLLVAILALNRKKLIPVIYPDYPNIEPYVSAVNIPVQIEDFPISLDCNNLSGKYAYEEKATQLILFTSGSSGVPKPCEITYENFYESAKMWDKIISFDDSDVYLNHMPLSHVGGLSIFFRSLYYNFEMILDDFSNENFIRHSNRITLISMVPSMIEILSSDINNINLKEIKACIVGGDQMSQRLLKIIKKTEISTYISYGLTETCSGIAGSWAEDFYDTFIYKAHPGVSLGLSDAALQIISPVVVKKYFNSNRLFNNKFITSDCVEIIEKNQFKFIKRMDGVFISGGKNISLSYVKKHILKIEGIYSCDLKIIDDERWGKVMHAALDVEENMNLKNIRQNLINVLPNYMVPKKMTIK